MFKWIKSLFKKQEEVIVTPEPMEYWIAIDADVVVRSRRMNEIFDNGQVYLIERKQKAVADLKIQFVSWVENARAVNQFMAA